MLNTTLLVGRYSEPEKFEIVEIPVPTLRDNDVLVCVPRNF